MLRSCKVGCLLLAGGQGTRLNHPGPKGTFPISPCKHKSLFQLCAEKVRAASSCAGLPLPLAIMTSPENDMETQHYFQSHAFFGLKEEQVSFFTQGTLPLLDSNGRLFLKTPYEVATGPDGNGNSFLSFAKSGLLEKWKNLEISTITVIPIDNPLADPFDAELIGSHSQRHNNITLKCTEKTDPEEKVGVIVKQDNRCKVIEYSEIPEKKKWAQRSDGKLKHCCANLSLFCFSLQFIDQMIRQNISLPLHKAWKAAHYVNHQGSSWKFETFIFDWLLYTDRVSALLYHRETCFAPLKNAEGTDSPETVRRALQNRDRAILQSLTGLPPPSFPFELSAEFYYPTSALKDKWKGKQAEPSDFDGGDYGEDMLLL
jgi:UDP-N-acetylglucosamine/UDP-N-acetylgalactosamine diphosphorylase